MTDTNTFNPADLDALAAVLVAGGVTSVSVDAAEVNVPGVWIRFDGVAETQLAGLTVNTTLFLIVGDGDSRQVLTRLAALYNQVAVALRPLGGSAGPATRAGVVQAAGTIPLPALAVPFDLLTTN